MTINYKDQNSDTSFLPDQFNCGFCKSISRIEMQGIQPNQNIYIIL